MLIKDHSQLTDQELEQQFETFKLKPKLFSHEAHLRLAYIHIKKYGAVRSEGHMTEQIKGYAESLGVYDKFNKTVTIASVRIMNHFMSSGESDDFYGLMNEFPVLLADFRSLLSRHYSFNVFGDKQAKKDFVVPDLIPFEI